MNGIYNDLLMFYGVWLVLNGTILGFSLGCELGIWWESMGFSDGIADLRRFYATVVGL